MNSQTRPALAPAGRRRCLQIAGALALLAAGPLRALTPQNASRVPPPATLTPQQSQVFRAWLTRLINHQLSRGPTPRWQHRDCAGLVRFAVAETLRDHDDAWRRANGIANHRLPPDLVLSDAQKALRHSWRLADGKRSAYVGALEMIQENTVFVGKDFHRAEPGDLFFFDQGDDQHLMVWMGRGLAYHTGTVTKTDNGLRTVTIQQLLQWRDTRWQPVQDNPNFVGVFRFAFLTR